MSNIDKAIQDSRDNGFLLLGELPEDHPLRNKPLDEIKAEYINIACPEVKGKRYWNMVLPSWKLAGKCYNQLKNSWIDTKVNIWRAVRYGMKDLGKDKNGIRWIFVNYDPDIKIKIIYQSQWYTDFIRKCHTKQLTYGTR